MDKKIKLIDADIAIDDRGELLFCNNFDMSKIKRFYHITNYNNPFIRAWHGHKIEAKLIKVIKGEFVVGAVKVNDWVSDEILELCCKDAGFLLLQWKSMS